MPDLASGIGHFSSRISLDYFYSLLFSNRGAPAATRPHWQPCSDVTDGELKGALFLNQDPAPLTRASYLPNSTFRGAAKKFLAVGESVLDMLRVSAVSNPYISREDNRHQSWKDFAIWTNTFHPDGMHGIKRRWLYRCFEGVEFVYSRLHPRYSVQFPPRRRLGSLQPPYISRVRQFDVQPVRDNELVSHSISYLNDIHSSGYIYWQVHDGREQSHKGPYTRACSCHVLPSISEMRVSVVQTQCLTMDHHFLRTSLKLECRNFPRKGIKLSLYWIQSRTFRSSIYGSPELSRAYPELAIRILHFFQFDTSMRWLTSRQSIQPAHCRESDPRSRIKTNFLLKRSSTWYCGLKRDIIHEDPNSSWSHMSLFLWNSSITFYHLLNTTHGMA
ncbi:hypothetical protein Agabi119p4_5741 [Agaricus bisporus var. burnettii]|uniref:Uncharacterized protein n=1 Tax=Agaricus bisporus var. burnettii TaxID=192524 RepID=A0A8H7F286_AGABI|nr:hypothetical protein Agabi119p4_5741 [Agaricus bisporus var. burnettii]